MTTLEKIRAEIEQHKNDKFNCIGVNDVLKIIDKYAEQEPCDWCDEIPEKPTMTREEAIYHLETYDDPIKVHEAYAMAIKALSQEPCEDAVRRTDMLDAVGHGTTYTTEHLQKIINGLPSVNPVPCEDAVSRQAVSEWYCNMTCDKDYCTEPCLEHKQIMMLPSVQPSRKGWEEMTVPCENCGHDMTFKIAVCGEPSNLPCEDAVSRQAVLDIIDAEAWAFCDYLIKEGRNAEQQPVSHFSDNLRERIRYKDELPSVQPKAKTGRCADCKYYHVKWDGTETHYFEDYWCEWVEPNEDDYCSLFEQKGGAE